jgi:hypothetical protein
VVRQGTAQTNAPEEMLDQSHAAELGQAHPIGGNAKIPWTATPCSRTALLVRFPRNQQNRPRNAHWQGFRASLRHPSRRIQVKGSVTIGFLRAIHSLPKNRTSLCPASA